MSTIEVGTPKQIVHKLIGDNAISSGFVHPVSYKTIECGNQKCKKVFKADTSLIGATCPECKTRGIIK